MNGVINALNWIAGLGPMVMMPIIMFVIGIILRQKIGPLLRSCMLTGVGFAGVNLTINFFISKVSPSVVAMVGNWNLQTDIMDVGWPARAAATWAFPMAAVVVFIVLGINVIMLALKWTNCVMVDFWSYNHFIFGAALSWYASGSVVVALITGGLLAAITFKLADWTQPLCEEAFGIPGVSFPTSNSVGWAPLAWLLNKVYDRIPGLNKIKADPESIQKRFGVLGEPMVVGSIMGLCIGILGGNSVGDTLVVGMSTATAMVLTPKMMQILMEGLVPFADGIKELLNTKFEGNRFHIGIDAALTIANPSAIAVGILMVPTTIILAAVLPGNRLLPLSDIAYMAMWLAAWPVAFGKGNVVRGFISCVIFTSIMLLISTGMAEIHTQLAISGGFQLTEGMKLISTEDAGTHIIEYIFSLISGFIGHLI
ncbi:PTS maltose transporter subunit IIABC [Fusibacter paucivorans]|uniref:PTS maltose transporter subunit IIABC n=1 Tax=Fusibacter paucivorans TaxID=76009 RepID=A0ABS5PRV3_9FIRM|nr:PTS transporter subunit IIC [Fusibacter paucivorans]MBS7527602.1 PTS maltose transporter subunit IIABC [Fusibacter paucivorans]